MPVFSFHVFDDLAPNLETCAGTFQCRLPACAFLRGSCGICPEGSRVGNGISRVAACDCSMAEIRHIKFGNSCLIKRNSKNAIRRRRSATAGVTKNRKSKYDCSETGHDRLQRRLRFICRIFTPGFFFEALSAVCFHTAPSNSREDNRLVFGLSLYCPRLCQNMFISNHSKNKNEFI